MKKTENCEKVASLVTKAKAMDSAAWDELYQDTVRQIYFVVKKIVSNQQDAEDLVQDTYITAFRNLAQLNEPENFRAWISKIAANKCKDYLKKNKAIAFADLQDEEGEYIQWEDEDTTWQPDVVLDEKETTRLVAEIIESLPEDQKLCVLLYYREELSVGEIAESLGVSAGTVKSRLNYARAKIKAQVLELEKKGTKLYGLAPIPFLIWLLKEEMAMLEIPAAIAVTSTAAAATTAGAGVAGASGAATGVSTTTATAVTASTAAAVKTGIFSTLGTKIAAGILAGVVGISGTAGIIVSVVRDRDENVAMEEELEEETPHEVPQENYEEYEEIIEITPNEFATLQLKDMVDFNKGWCWKEEYIQGSVRSNIIYTFAFKDDGTLVYTVGIEYSDMLGAYYGTYTEAGGCITIELDWGNGTTGKFTYEVVDTADGFSLVQVSDAGIFDSHEKGQVLNLTEEINNDAERHWWFAEVFSDPNYEEWY